MTFQRGAKPRKRPPRDAGTCNRPPNVGRKQGHTRGPPEMDERRRGVVAGRGGERTVGIRGGWDETRYGRRHGGGWYMARTNKQPEHPYSNRRNIRRPTRRCQPVTTRSGRSSSDGRARTHAARSQRFRPVFPPFAGTPYHRMRGVPYGHSAEARRRAFSEEPRSDDKGAAGECTAVRRWIGRCSPRRFGRQIPRPR